MPTRFRLVFANPETAFKAVNIDVVLADPAAGKSILDTLGEKPQTFGALRGKTGLLSSRQEKQARHQAEVNVPAFKRDIERYLRLRAKLSQSGVAGDAGCAKVHGPRTFGASAEAVGDHAPGSATGTRSEMTVGEIRPRAMAPLRLLCIAVIALAFVFIACWFGGYRLNLTPSYPLSLWRIQPLSRSVRVGDRVFICPPETNMNGLLRQLNEAAGRGATVVVFPESGLGFWTPTSRDTGTQLWKKPRLRFLPERQLSDLADMTTP